MSFAASGVNCAVATPLNADFTPDHGRFAAHCNWLLGQGCHGIALLGTTGEANSFSVGERKAILEAALEAGIGARPAAAGDGRRGGTGHHRAHASRALDRRHQGRDAAALLLQERQRRRLFAAYARIIEGVGDEPAQDHPLPHPADVQHAVEPRTRPAAARGLPDTVIGIKDSGGDLTNMQEMVKENPGLAVLSGADPLMLPLLKSGGAGCITAASNFIAPQMRFIFDNWADAEKAAEVEAAQATVVAYRTLSTTYMQLPTVKAIIALKSGDMSWNRLVPPLMPLSEAQFEDIRAKLAGLP
jgi:4-hydroxy-tetrahydrodipicolinate synthase